MTEFEVVERAPTLEEYREICAAVGWQDVVNFSVAQTSLGNALHSVVVTHAGQAVGMGRIVGDGAIYFYLQDVAVLPAYQDRGVGNLIMENLLAYLDRHAPDKAFIGLFAASGTYAFYEQYGFGKHRTLTAMFKIMSTAET
jgi:ribosomal protein S18 acetylase RimI-like enzyme